MTAKRANTVPICMIMKKLTYYKASTCCFINKVIHRVVCAWDVSTNVFRHCRGALRCVTDQAQAFSCRHRGAVRVVFYIKSQYRH